MPLACCNVAMQTNRVRGAWVDAAGGRESFPTYATAWPAQRADLWSRTRDIYGGLLE